MCGRGYSTLTEDYSTWIRQLSVDEESKRLYSHDLQENAGIPVGYVEDFMLERFSQFLSRSETEIVEKRRSAAPTIWTEIVKTTLAVRMQWLAAIRCGQLPFLASKIRGASLESRTHPNDKGRYRLFQFTPIVVSFLLLHRAGKQQVQFGDTPGRQAPMDATATTDPPNPKRAKSSHR